MIFVVVSDIRMEKDKKNFKNIKMNKIDGI